MKLTENARTILEKRYLRKDARGQALETPVDMLRRVASNIAGVEATCYKKAPDQVREMASEKGFYSEDFLDRLSKKGGVQGDPEVPGRVQCLFKTALEMDYSWHIKHQAAFQKYTDNAVSKTVNLPYEATVEEVKEAYLMAWKLGSKGITVYRDSSRSSQVLSHAREICFVCEAETLVRAEGCVKCHCCGFSECF